MRRTVVLVFFSAVTFGAEGPVPKIEGELHKLRSHIASIEKQVLGALKNQKNARARLQEIRKLMSLRTQEQKLGRLRLNSLEKTLHEMESKRKHLQDRMNEGRRGIHDSLKAFWLSLERRGQLERSESDLIERGRSRVLAGLIERGVRDIESLKIDLSDAEVIEGKIQQERDQLAYLFQDLREKESLLELHKNMQIEILRKQHTARVEQLEQYRKLKSSEAQLEGLLQQFSARYEFQKLDEQEREESRAVHLGSFSAFRGKLSLPVEGKIENGFGRTFDPKTKMYVFKKGVTIASSQKGPVQSVFAGRVAFAGELPGYGRVVILDHGGNYYSLYGNLGQYHCRNGDFVTTRGNIGITDEKGSSIYFEIRSKNVPVNPLQWMIN